MAGGQLRIEELFAFVVVDPADNTEGVPAFQSSMGPVPMMGADMAMVEKLRPIAQEVASAMGVEITLCRFEVRTEVEVLKP